MKVFNFDRAKPFGLSTGRPAAVPKRLSRRSILRVSLITGLAILWAVLTIDILWPAISDLGDVPAALKAPGPGGANYLVVAPQALEKSASAWLEYRRRTGYQAKMVLLPTGQADMQGIGNVIQKEYAESGKPYPFYVLLIGHAHPHSSHPAAYLPAAHFSVDPGQFSGYGLDPIPSEDGLVADLSGGIPGNSPPIFAGRIPARTDEEALQLLERTRSYEETPPAGEGRARIELVTSNAGFGSQYDPLFEWALRTLMQKVLPDETRWHLLNGNAASLYSYPVYFVPQEFARRFDSGALAVVYVGHGQPDLLGWAHSSTGARSRIFRIEDAGLIQKANTSLGIFTACSAGDYDLDGDKLSVVESIFLTPGGPVATYSSSAWINGALNGRLVIDIFEVLLVEKAPTLGEWAGRVEARSGGTRSHIFLTAAIRSILPWISGTYEGKLLLSPEQARQVVDIQHATYNVFGDPALRIAYSQPGLEVSPRWTWQPWKGSLTFSGSSNLPAGQAVTITLERLPGGADLAENPPGTIEQYLRANDLVLTRAFTTIDQYGKFSGRFDLPQRIPNGKYLLRAAVYRGKTTYETAHPVILGGLPIGEILCSAVFWWCLTSILLWSNLGARISRNRRFGPLAPAATVTNVDRRSSLP